MAGHGTSHQRFWRAPHLLLLALSTIHPPHLSLQQGIQKLIRLLEGQQESQFNAEQYMMLYT